MDQAHGLRQLASQDRLKANMITVISGKGGVGKTSLVIRLHKNLHKSLIIESDINSPYFCYFGEGLPYEMGYKAVSQSQSKHPRGVDNLSRARDFEYLLVDAGTGINSVNKYYLDRSRCVVIVTDSQKSAILNTVMLLKKINGRKIVFAQCKDEEFNELKRRIEDYAKYYLNGQSVRVVNDERSLIDCVTFSIF